MNDRLFGALPVGAREAVRVLRRQAGVASAGLALSSLGVFFLAATFLPRDVDPRFVGSFLLVVGLASCAGLWILGRRRARVELSLPTLLSEVEDATGLGDGELRAAAELTSTAPGESEDLARAHRQTVSREVGGRPSSELLPVSDHRWRRRWVTATMATSVVLGLVTASAFVRPSATARAARLWAAPWRALASPSAAPLRVEAPLRVPRGRAVPIGVTAPGRDHVLLFEQVVGEPSRARDVRLDPKDGTAEVQSEPVRSRMRIWAADEHGRRSEISEIVPLDPLLLRGLSLELRYPRHLGRPTERLERPFPVLVLPEGTTVDVSGAANGSLLEAALHPPEGVAVAFGVEGERFSGRFRPAASGLWTWTMRAAGPTPGVVVPPGLQIRLVRDGVPVVRILHPEGDRALGGELRLPLVVDVQDDNGISEVELVSWKGGGGTDPPTVRSIAPASTAPRMVLRPVLEADRHRLLPGDTLYYFVRARDGNPMHEGAASDTLRAFLPTLGELREAAALAADSLARRTEELASSIEDLRRRAQEAEGRARAAGAAARTPGSAPPTSMEGLSYEATEEGRAVVERAETLEQHLKELLERVGSLESLSETLLDPRLREEMRRLEELYGRLLESELREDIAELRNALLELRPESLREALDRLATDASRLQEELERSAASLERAAVEQGVRAAQGVAEELADRQDALARAEAMDEGWRREEASVATDAEELERQIDGLRERLEAALTADVSPAALQSLQKAGREVAEAAERARSATGAAESSGESGTPAAADSAAGRLSDAAASLQAAERSLARDWSEEAAAALERARREALALASEQQALAGRFTGRTALAPSELQGRQAALRRGLDNLFGSLAEAGRRTGLLDRGSALAAAEAAGRMEEVLSRLQGQGDGQRPTRGEGEAVAAALNELAARLLAGARAAKSTVSGGTGAEMLEQLAQAARMQEGLGRRSASLLRMREAGRPVGSQLESLAERQAEVERSLHEASELASEQEALLGRPEELAEEAGELARRLRSGELDRETAERQETLFRRLLDAGRSLEREDEEPDRRISRPGSQLPTELEGLDPALLSGPRYPHPAETVLRELPPAYRWMVLDYFDRLNRSAVTPPAEDGS